MTAHLDNPMVVRTRALLVAAASLLLFAGGCTSRATSGGADEKAAAASGLSQTIDVNCMGDRFENPPEVFHYSYKTTGGQNNVDKEADITPQSMEITIQDDSGSHKYHGAKSDESSWNGAVLNLAGSTVMTARLGFLKDTAAFSRAGAEQINGYSTTKYTIDSTKAGSSVRSYAAFFGSSSYDQGSMWVSAEGCPVKVDLEEATQQPDGNVNNVHFELNFVKK